MKKLTTMLAMLVISLSAYAEDEKITKHCAFIASLSTVAAEAAESHLTWYQVRPVMERATSHITQYAAKKVAMKVLEEIFFSTGEPDIQATRNLAYSKCKALAQ